MSLAMADSPAQLCERMRRAIQEALPDAETEVLAASPGHFEIRVVSAAFAGKGPVDQQRLVYAAIRPFMSGESPPVHAIDRLQTRAR
jgi:stress-induced morphogen